MNEFYQKLCVNCGKELTDTPGIRKTTNRVRCTDCQVIVNRKENPFFKLFFLSEKENQELNPARTLSNWEKYSRKVDARQKLYNRAKATTDWARGKEPIWPDYDRRQRIRGRSVLPR